MAEPGGKATIVTADALASPSDDMLNYASKQFCV